MINNINAIGAKAAIEASAVAGSCRKRAHTNSKTHSGTDRTQ